MMTDKEQIRRALLGDKQAQEECTAKGIVLPCPKCLSDDVKIEGDGHNIYDPDTLGYLDSVPDSILYITCDNCNLCSDAVVVDDEEEREDAERRLIADWNARPAPPVGRCEECKCWQRNGSDWGSCSKWYTEDKVQAFMLKTDFCSSFDPREE
mgnify:CR=1 FL=1